jgi:hypothetical protein
MPYSGRRRTKGQAMADIQLWKVEPEDHDYPAAEDYLTLLFEKKTAKKLVKKLKHAEIHWRKAKDLLRASALTALDPANPHVAHDLQKVADGKALSPVLLIRGDGEHHRPLIIADGYHRVCASWYTNEDAPIPCRLVSND